MTTPPTISYPHVTGVFGDQGENEGVLAVMAILDPSPHYPDNGRIIVGSPTETPSIGGYIPDLGGFSMGLAGAERLIAVLQRAVTDIRTATGQAGALTAASDDGIIDNSAAELQLTRGVLLEVSDELGIPQDDTRTTHGIACQTHTAILKLRNSGADIDPEAGQALVKGDSLAQAIQHNLDMRAHLESEVARLRLVVQRVAEALQVQQFDSDGLELLERINRWQNLKFTIRSRRKELLASGAATSAVDELNHLLAFVTLPKELAEWLSSKPKPTATDAVIGLGESPRPAASTIRPITTADISYIRSTGMELGDGHDERAYYLYDLVKSICAASSASNELVNLVNLVVIPLVERHRAATAAPRTW